MEDRITSNLIIASAGTGKTYQLTSRFVTLMAMGVEPERMIALTFTNKAAGEFRNRIFQAVAEGASGKVSPVCPSRNILAVRIWEALTGVGIQEGGQLVPKEGSSPLYAPAVAMQQQAVGQGLYPEEVAWPLFGGRIMDATFFSEMLEKLVDKASQLHLSTLDSFFGAVVAASGRMASSLHALQPLSDAKLRAARMEVLHEVWSPRRIPGEERETFASLCRDIAGDSGKSIFDSLYQYVEKHLGFFRQHPEAHAWGNAKAIGLPDCSEEPPLEQEELDAFAADIARHVGCLTWKKVQGSKQRFRVEDGLLQLVGKIRQNQFALHKTKSVLGWLNREKNYLPLPEEEGEDDDLRELVWQLYGRYRRCLLRQLQKKTAGMYDLLARYEKLYRELILGSGRASFTDITRAATDILSGDTATMSLRLHFGLEHWMLDEFQDTNPEQWQAIRHLLEENASDGSGRKSILVVGDKKQSIYGFRGATPGLFDMLRGKRILPGETFSWSQALLPVSLHTSRRSSPEIISFVKTLFSQIEEVEQEDFQKMETCGEIAGKGGYVQLSLLPNAPMEQQEEAACERIGNILLELTEHPQKGQRRMKGGMSIAVLTRNNEHAERIHHWLRQHCPQIPVQLVSDTFVAAASPLGEMLMSFFLWLQHPGDKYRLHVLQASPLRSLFLLPDGREGKGICPPHQHIWEIWRHRLEEEGYAATLQRLVSALPQLEHPRLIREWLEAAYAFDATGGSLQDWLLEIQSLSMKGDASPGYVQVMTIHKSKGMEFDAVILPLLSANAVDNRQHMDYIVSEGNEGLLLSPSALVRDAWLDELAPYESAWGKGQRQEAYNLLYVALTRAKRANYILLNGKEKIPEYSYTGIIKEAIRKGQPEWQEEQGMQLGSPHWYESLEEEKRRQGETEQEQPASSAMVQPLGKAWKRLTRKSPSQMGTGNEATQTHAISPATWAAKEQATERGSAVHALFENILWLEGHAMPAWVEHPCNEAENMASRALKEPEIRRIFQRNTYPEGTLAYNEQNIDAVIEGVWLSAIIDRLVIQPGGPALIFDYKSNRDASHLTETYHSQMTSYRQLVAQALGLPLGKVQAYLVAIGCSEPQLIPCALES